MRWWTAGWMVVGVVVLSACSVSTGGGSAGEAPGSRPAGPSTGGPTRTSAPGGPAGEDPPASPTTPSVSTAGCAAGHTEVTVRPGAAVVQRLCVRPGTEVTLVLEPRTDDKRWRAVRSSAPAFVLQTGWRVDADGTARASLRCTRTRAGAAKVTALAKTPDVAGAARVAFTLHVTVVPYPREG